MIVGEYADVGDMSGLFKKKKKAPPPAPAPEPIPDQAATDAAAAKGKAIKATGDTQSFASKYSGVFVVGGVTVVVVAAAAFFLMRSPKPMAALPVSVAKKL
jgi:hypothetical protein